MVRYSLYGAPTHIDGASFLRAVANKERTYPKLARPDRYGELMVWLARQAAGGMIEPHDGFEAHQGEDADSRIIVARRSLVGFLSSVSVYLPQRDVLLRQ